MTTKIPYNTAIEMASEHLKRIGNIKDYCKKHKISYLPALTIKNKAKKIKYPKIIKSILHLMGFFQIEIIKETYFKILTEKKQSKNQHYGKRNKNS